MSALYKRTPVLAGYLDLLAKQGARKNTCGRRPLKADRSLQVLVADLVTARAAAGMTQEEVAVSMGTTKSVVSRLESGVCTRPTLSTKLIDRVAALVPPPHLHRHCYFGVLAPNSPLRAAVTALALATSTSPPPPIAEPAAEAAHRRARPRPAAVGGRRRRTRSCR